MKALSLAAAVALCLPLSAVPARDNLTLTGGLVYHPVAPCLAVDTRAEGGGGEIGANTFRAVSVAGRCGVPSTARAVQAYVGVPSPSRNGYLSFYTAQGPLLRQSSVINYDAAGYTATNGSILPLRADGGLTVYSNTAVDMTLTVHGYFAPQSEAAPGLTFRPLAPCRLTDTRTDSQPLPAGQPRLFTAAGRCGVPSTAAVLAANITTIAPAAGSLEVFNAVQAPMPGDFTSTVAQWRAGEVARAAGALIPLNTGQFAVRTATPGVHTAIDVYGYFAPGASFEDPGHKFFAIEPCRVYDTRLVGPADRDLDFVVKVTGGACAIPTGASAVAMNLTATNFERPGHLRVYREDGPPRRETSALNYTPRHWATANGFVTPLAHDGEVTVFNSGAATDFLVDVSGYFAAEPPANLLVNSRFDSNLDGWVSDPRSSIYEWNSRDSADRTSGSARVSGDTSRSCPVPLYQIVPVTAGTTYRASALAFIPPGQNAAAEAYVGVFWMNIGGGVFGPEDAVTSRTAGTWHRMCGQFTAPAGATQAIVYVDACTSRNGGNPPFVAQFDDVTFTSGPTCH